MKLRDEPAPNSTPVAGARATAEVHLAAAVPLAALGLEAPGPGDPRAEDVAAPLSVRIRTNRLYRPSFLRHPP
jgi:hypothetical protein